MAEPNDFYVNNIGYGPETFGRNAPVFTDVRVLAADTAVAHTIPVGIEKGVKFVVFSSTSNFFAKIDAVAAVPLVDVTDGSGSELNPSVWFIEGSTTIGLISSGVATITMSFHK